MNLLEALRPGALPRLAFTGAGGKTTAMFQLGRQLLDRDSKAGKEGPAVLITATTHLATHQVEMADCHHVITSLEAAAALLDRPLAGLTALTGPEVEPGRLSGLDEAILDQVLVRADQNPLLIEADGARQRPLKAPAEHEPPIPAWVNAVLVVAGLSGLGKPLDSQWVHRPEHFAALAGLRAGSPVEPEGLARVLADPLGGLKNIPAQCRRVLLLNQADTPDLQSAGLALAERLNKAFPEVLIASLAPPIGLTAEVFAAIQPTAGIILAAGGASRYGQPKQLLTMQGEPIVRRSARTALEAGLDPVVLVTGAYRAEVSQAVADLPITLVDNPEWEAGQGVSVAVGIKALPASQGAAIFLLADQPNVTAILLRSLRGRHSETLAPIVAPLVDGQRGNPVLFDRQTFDDLAALTGDTGGRALFSRYPVEWLPWHDASLLLDIDRREDYQRLVEGSSG